jgi:hypothetical protein
VFSERFRGHIHSRAFVQLVARGVFARIESDIAAHDGFLARSADGFATIAGSFATTARDIVSPAGVVALAAHDIVSDVGRFAMVADDIVMAEEGIARLAGLIAKCDKAVARVHRDIVSPAGDIAAHAHFVAPTDRCIALANGPGTEAGSFIDISKKS